MKSESSEPGRNYQQTKESGIQIDWQLLHDPGIRLEERKRLGAEELVAIRDTIKLLNDDDSLELFEKLCQAQLRCSCRTIREVSTARREL